MANLDEKTPEVEAFINRWEASGASERSNYGLFLTELCQLLGVPAPEPAREDDTHNHYVFEKPVVFEYADQTTSTGFIDLFKRGCFVLEAKQGSDGRVDELATSLGVATGRRRAGTARRGTAGWDNSMLRARRQAESYARALPDEWPPFLIIVDVGHCIELYADFEQLGKHYHHFPDPAHHRIMLRDLRRAEVRRLLVQIWSDPLNLDPSRRAAEVTREVAARLAILARSFENQGHRPEDVAGFLLRILFTMFAEDVGLIPPKAFSKLLGEHAKEPGTLALMLDALWREMDRGGFSVVLSTMLPKFNGSFFADRSVLPLAPAQIELLIDAAKSDWAHVEPAIFGTLLERALDPRERQKLGAHYTPRAYVERLVMPTVIDPLRDQWEAVQIMVADRLRQATTEAASLETARKDAIKQLRAFHGQLCDVRVLDPACGSGNFLYIAMEHMKRLEAEIIGMLHDLGQTQVHMEMQSSVVDPHQFLGLEINPRAAAITELVLWLGYLQWHFRTRSDAQVPEPVLRDFHNIETRDAVLAWDGEPEMVYDENLHPVTVWDGESTTIHPTTGRPVPDESARVPLFRYRNPRPAVWPAADFIVGNPPFIGNSRMRSELGDGYTETLRSVYPDVPQSCDYVMYWWNQAATRLQAGDNTRPLQRFGLISTNSITQKFSRQILHRHLEADDGLSLVFAIPDHPWVDSTDGADVRIAMTVAQPGPNQPGRLLSVQHEIKSDAEIRQVVYLEEDGRINSDLTVGIDVTAAVPLLSNDGLCCPGMKLHGSGFIVTPEQATQLGLGTIPGLDQHIRPYLNGRDLTQKSRGVCVIDLFGLTSDEVRARFPAVYQWVAERVKPERDQNRRATYRDNWWVFGEARSAFRPALRGLLRYIATVETSKHRAFLFVDGAVIPDNKLIAIASNDAFVLGVLSSRFHVIWALTSGGRLGVGNDPVYVKSRCFDTFPFPDCGVDHNQRVRDLADQLDAHRQRQQAAYPELTITAMYNVLAKVRRGEPLEAGERQVHERALCTVLRELHDELDIAVADAYGWPHDLTEQDVLKNIVELNRERLRDEGRGQVRWLRPDYQAPIFGIAAVQQEFDKKVAPDEDAAAANLVWPEALAERVRAVRQVLQVSRRPMTTADVARCFVRARKDVIAQILETLADLGQTRDLGDGRFVSQ